MGVEFLSHLHLPVFYFGPKLSRYVTIQPQEAREGPDETDPGTKSSIMEKLRLEIYRSGEYFTREIMMTTVRILQLQSSS